jgi:hypothetical protein
MKGPIHLENNDLNNSMIPTYYMKIDKRAYGFNRGIVDMLIYNRP